MNLKPVANKRGYTCNEAEKRRQDVCGIAGIVEAQGSPDEMLLKRMCDLLSHRGPDGEGFHVSGRAGLGMRRLAIIDVAGGWQPIFNEDNSAWIVYNGEVYNHLDVRAGLESAGHVYRTRCDTETILHAYEEYGDRCVEHLRGMFAFAIWDARNQRLFAARDRFGEKPLYYAVTPDGALLFASEIAPLLASGRIPRDIDQHALELYLTFGYIPAPYSIYRHIRKLPPASILTYQPGETPQIQRYWEMQFDPQPADARDWQVEFKELLRESVRIRLMSEVPLGAFLSGGLDSSSIVAFMAEAMDRPVKTFTVGLREETHDESAYAAQVAQAFKTEHHTRIVSADLVDVLPTLARHFGEPFGDPSALPTYHISKVAREQVTVVLTGDGGDELLAGYERYAVALNDNAGALPAPARALAGVAADRLPFALKGRGRLARMALDTRERFLYNATVFDNAQRRALIGAGANGHPYRLADAALHAPDFLTAMQMTDISLYLPDDINVKVDRMSMACSLETRPPFLDHKLAEFIGTMPRALFHDGKRGKLVLRQMMAEILPPAILNRPKMGFGLPLAAWMRDHATSPARLFLDEANHPVYSYISRNTVKTLLNEHERGARDWSTQLWSLMMLGLWVRAA
jgi:asparagine synthase (glutamine-hydrolysing)